MALFFLFFKTVIPPKQLPQEKTISLSLQQFVTPKKKPIVSKRVPLEEEVKKTSLKPSVFNPPQKTITPKQTKARFSLPMLPILKENNVTKVLKRKIAKTKKPKKVRKKRRYTKKKKHKRKKYKKRKKHRKIKKYKKKRRVKRTKKTQPSLAQTLLNAGKFTPAYTNSQTQKESSMIRDFYGREFNTYTHTQKQFISHNLGIIHRITQRTLTQNGYPRVAIYTQQQGRNIVSFYLQPNGDITNLRIKTSSGYTALDKNTLKVIKIAYKDYPLPNEKTKIIFNVEYRFY